MVDLDLTGEDHLKQRLNIAVTIRPMRINVAASSDTEDDEHETPDRPRLW
jgi:gamma-glutamylcysteine synthetase